VSQTDLPRAGEYEISEKVKTTAAVENQLGHETIDMKL
jgi:hypothetical protein